MVASSSVQSKPAVCPWNIFGSSKIPSSVPTKDTPPTIVEKRKPLSYADATQIKAAREIDESELPNLDWNGDFPMIKLAKADIDQGVEKCKLSLVGRLDLKKMKIERVKELTQKYWGLKENLQVIPLGKGFIMFKFTNGDDFLKIWGQGSFFWDNQYLRLSKWHPNFSTEMQTQSNALVWVKFPGLAMEYWEPKNLMAMARPMGSPLHLDDFTAARTNGYYAMVLCDVDLNYVPPQRIWVEVENTDIRFWQKIEMGKMPAFCTHCRSIGHSLNDCDSLKKYLEVSNTKSPNETAVQQQETVQKSFYTKAQKKRWNKKMNQNDHKEDDVGHNGPAMIQDQLTDSSPQSSIVYLGTRLATVETSS